MTEENGTQPQQPASGQVTIQVTPQGMTIMITPQPIGLSVDEANMNVMVADWLNSHPALFDELIKKRLEQKKAELKLIQHIHGSKLN